MKILVLGATGFLGKAICRNLDGKNIPYTKTSKSLGLDLRNYDDTLDFFKSKNPDIIINCASFVGGIQFGYKYPADIFDNNLRMNVNILKAAAETGIKRIVNPISNCVYPAEATLFKEKEIWNGPMHESVMVYGFVRKAFWIGSWAYNRQHGLDVINLVLSNMYGPEDHFEEERSHALGALIMKFANAKKNNLPQVVVWGSGKPVREWLHVDDGAEALIRAIDIEPYTDFINIGVAEGISILELAQKIKKFIGYNGEIKLDKSKPDGAKYKTVDGSIGKKLLGWTPQINLDDGIKQTIEWYLKHEKEYS